MTTENTGNCASAKTMTVPSPLILSRLRDHFRQTYLLNEIQAETMLVSSAKSLSQALGSAHEVLRGAEPESRFALIFHSLKGLLLNMGESDWAAYTKDLETQLAAGGQIDYAAAIGIVEKGLAEILSYGKGMAPEPLSRGAGPEQAKHGGTSGGD